jgi:Mn2+/Fe2+ NRAMP family transporter
MSELRAQDLANKVFPGLGHFLALLIVFGGFVFNIGNIAGCGLGWNVLTGLKPEYGALVSCIISIVIFWNKNAGNLIDILVKGLGILMIGLTIYVAIVSTPPLGEALCRTVVPQKINMLMIVTLVGGTVGGYISFAGAHRLMDAGIKGKASLSLVDRSALSGITISAIMRYILFLAALGVVWGGVHLDAHNPAASVFQHAAGDVGYKFFGIVIWCAAITSVIGASFTSVSFWKTLHPVIEKNEKIFVTLFIIASTIVFTVVGNPVKLLILAGAFNGLILPLALGIMLIAVGKSSLMHQYRHPGWMQVTGYIVVLVMSYMSIVAIQEGLGKLF